MLITFLCLLFNFNTQNISARAVNFPVHRNVISTQPTRVFCIMPFKHTCLRCELKFTSLQRNRKYCTLECYMNTKNRRTIINCATCGKEIIKLSESTKFCSQKCYRINDNQIRNCIYCDHKFKVAKSVINRGNDAGKFCSQECVNNYRKGDKNPNWRGGFNFDAKKKTRELIKIRPIIRYMYNNTCQKCGAKGTNVILDVHHIVPYRLTKDNSFKNLTLLCHSCHMKEAKNEIKIFK